MSATSSIEWVEVRPGVQVHSVREERSEDDWPGVVVSYGQDGGCRWYVGVELDDDHRRSDAFGSEAEAREAAEAFIRGCWALWPAAVGSKR